MAFNLLNLLGAYDMAQRFGEKEGTLWDKLGLSGFNEETPEAQPITTPIQQLSDTPYQGNVQPTQAPVMATQPVSDRQVVDLGRPPIVNNDIPTTIENTQGSMDAMDMMGMFPQNMASSATDQAWESQRPQEPVEEPSFMDKASDFFNEERMARMTIALNSMRLNPDPNIAKSMENKLESLSKRKGANRSVQWLRDNATPTNQYDKYADLIEKNPEMASELLKQAMGIGKGGYKTSAVQVDPETGQKYVVKTNPADGSVIREDIEGATGTTYQQEQDIASKARLKEQDTKDAYKASQDVFMEAQDMRGNVRELYKMIPLLDKGAETGLLRQYLPSFKANTAQLRTIGNKLGINVINMATFGALSEKELNLALKTAIDLSLPPTELKKQILMKIEAQEKLMNELYGEAQKLSAGTVGYQEYINENSKKFLRSQETRYNALNEEEKKAVSNDVWMGMNLQQREAFINARSK
mgnify:CR=1 FL=1